MMKGVFCLLLVVLGMFMTFSVCEEVLEEGVVSWRQTRDDGDEDTDNTDLDDDDDFLAAPTRRNITDVTFSREQLMFTSTSFYDSGEKEGQERDEFTFGLSTMTSNQQMFEVAFVYEKGNNRVHYEIGYNLSFIFEYNKSQSPDFQGFDDNNHCIGCISDNILGPAQWNISSDEERGSFEWTFSGPLGGDADGGTLMIHVWATEDTHMVERGDGEAVFDTNTVKMDIEVVDYQWKSRENGRLAMGFNIDTEEPQLGTSNSNGNVALNFGFPDVSEGAVFSWVDNIFVEGQGTAPVDVSPLPPNNADLTNYALYYSFLTENNADTTTFLWDPEVGATYATAEPTKDNDGLGTGAIVGIVFGVIAVIVILGLLVYLIVNRTSYHPEYETVA